MTKAEEKGLYGVMAEFEDPNSVVAAARKTYEAGYRRINAYSPYPIEELSEAIGFHKDRVPVVVFCGGLLGALGGLGLQIWTSAIEYPLNVGGRPYISLPAFVPITYECMILVAALGAVIGMLMLNGLPQPYHPVFNLPSFKRASTDRFYLCIEADDPRFNHEQAKTFLSSLGAKEVSDVEK
jgi:hypothetical protein